MGNFFPVQELWCTNSIAARIARMASIARMNYGDPLQIVKLIFLRDCTSVITSFSQKQNICNIGTKFKLPEITYPGMLQKILTNVLSATDGCFDWFAQFANSRQFTFITRLCRFYFIISKLKYTKQNTPFLNQNKSIALSSFLSAMLSAIFFVLFTIYRMQLNVGFVWWPN